MALRQLGSRLLAQTKQGRGGPALLPGALVSCFSSISSSLPPVDAFEVAKALRAQQFSSDELEHLRAQTGALPHSQLLEFFKQRCATSCIRWTGTMARCPLGFLPPSLPAQLSLPPFALLLDTERLGWTAEASMRPQQRMLLAG